MYVGSFLGFHMGMVSEVQFVELFHMGMVSEVLIFMWVRACFFVMRVRFFPTTFIFWVSVPSSLQMPQQNSTKWISQAASATGTDCSYYYCCPPP